MSYKEVYLNLMPVKLYDIFERNPSIAVWCTVHFIGWHDSILLSLSAMVCKVLTYEFYDACSP